MRYPAFAVSKLEVLQEMLKELWLGLGVESNIKVSLKEIESIGVEWNRLGHCRVLW